MKSKSLNTMMEQLNKVELLGRIGTVRTQAFPDATVINFSVATEYAFKNRNGEETIETTWHNCVYWDRDGRKAGAVVKGAMVHVKGRIRVRKYTGNDGTEKYVTEIVAAWIDVKTEDNTNDDLPEDIL